MSKKTNENRKNLNALSESDALDFVNKLYSEYKKMDSFLKKDYDELIKIKETFPVRLVESEDFEDLLIKASNAKFKAIVLVRKLTGLYSEIEYELDFIISNFKLYIADDALSDKFDKITEGLREAYVNSKSDLIDLKELKKSIEVFADSAEKLVKMFDSDEVNFRRIAEKKNKLLGFS